MNAGKKADRQGIMIPQVSFLPGDNPDFQGQEPVAPRCCNEA